MTYDIVAFDPKSTSTEKFVKWYAKQAVWLAADDTDGTRDDPSVTTSALQDFYTSLSEIYPPVNGRFAPSLGDIAADPGLESRLTEYRIGPHLIYAAFPIERQTQATKTFEGLAARHRVAVARVSRDPITISRPRIVRSRWPFRRRA